MQLYLFRAFEHLSQKHQDILRDTHSLSASQRVCDILPISLKQLIYLSFMIFIENSQIINRDEFLLPILFFRVELILDILNDLLKVYMGPIVWEL